MKPELTAFYSAIISAVVSFLVGWISSRWAVRLEIEKLRLGTQQLAFVELLKMRIQHYPELYSILSDLAKVARDHTAVDLRQIRDRVEKWDSAHAIFMSRNTSNTCYHFRSILSKAVESQSDRKITMVLLDAAMQLELALRSDMGIHGIGVSKADLTTKETETY